MTMPKAYQPTQDQTYQILQWDDYNREYDHLDYAVDRKERDFLLAEYRLGQPATKFKTIKLPKKYHPKKEDN